MPSPGLIVVAKDFFEALPSLLESILVGLALAVEKNIDFSIETFGERFAFGMQINNLICLHG